MRFKTARPVEAQDAKLGNKRMGDRACSKLAMVTMLVRWSGPTSYDRMRCSSVKDSSPGSSPDGPGDGSVVTAGVAFCESSRSSLLDERVAERKDS